MTCSMSATRGVQVRSARGRGGLLLLSREVRTKIRLILYVSNIDVLDPENQQDPAKFGPDPDPWL